MKLSDYLSDVGRPVAFYPSLVKAMGNRNDAIFICQMAYWKDKGEDPNGWIYKESSEIEKETSLTYKEQIRVRKRLKKVGILHEKYYKSIHRMYFKIDWDVFNSLWDVRDLCEAPDQWSYTTCPLVSSLIGNTYTTHRLNKEMQKMCDKCEYLKQKIELGKEYGFEYDVQASIEMLKNLVELHKTEDPTEHRKVTQNERIVAMMQGSKDEYADKLADYPETVQKSVKIFVETFKLSPSAIPKKSKGKGGLYATWVKGIQDLQSIAGNERRYKLVIDKVFGVWDNRDREFKTHIDMPQKIRGAFITMEAELRGEEEKKKTEIAEKVEQSKVEKQSYITDNEDLKKKAISDLKKMRRMNDNNCN